MHLTKKGYRRGRREEAGGRSARWEGGPDGVYVWEPKETSAKGDQGSQKGGVEIDGRIALGTSNGGNSTRSTAVSRNRFLPGSLWPGVSRSEVLRREQQRGGAVPQEQGMAPASERGGPHGSAPARRLRPAVKERLTPGRHRRERAPFAAPARQSLNKDAINARLAPVPRPLPPPPRAPQGQAPRMQLPIQSKLCQTRSAGGPGGSTGARERVGVKRGLSGVLGAACYRSAGGSNARGARSARLPVAGRGLDGRGV